MVKPARLGSSVGMTLVHDPSELDAALETAFRHDTLVLAETYLPNARDLEVAIIGNGPAGLELFGPGEIVSGHEFYDYEAKYTAGLSETSTRAEVTDRQRATLHKIARDAYRAIGAEGFARVDFLLSGETIVLSEINTIPGFTPISLFPTMPAEGGYTFGGVCVRIVDLAARTARRPGRPPPDRRGPAPMSGRPVARRSRTPVPARRGRSVRRASAGLSAVRAGAALAMLVSAAAIYGVGASSAFDYTKLELTGAEFTDPAAVEAALGGGRGENLFGLSTGPMVAALESMPTVAGARVEVHLPGTLAVTLDREDADPRLAGRQTPLPGGQRRFAVRRGGRSRARRCGIAAGRRRPAGGGRSPQARLDARPGRPRRGHPARVAQARRRGQRGRLAGRRGHGRERLRGRDATRHVGRDLRLLYAQPAHDRADPRAGPAVAQPPGRP